jgi:hypothetical protein
MLVNETRMRAEGGSDGDGDDGESRTSSPPFSYLMVQNNSLAVKKTRIERKEKEKRYGLVQKRYVSTSRSFLTIWIRKNSSSSIKYSLRRYVFVALGLNVNDSSLRTTAPMIRVGGLGGVMLYTREHTRQHPQMGACKLCAAL